MLDDNKIFRTRVNKKLPPAESKAILWIFGFEGVLDFSKRAGINHETAGALLGTIEKRTHKHHYTLIAANEALHTAYIEVREQLSKPTRRYVCDWAKRWQKDVVQNKLMIESLGKISGNTPAMIKDRNRKRKKVLAGVLTAFKSLEWK